MAFFEMRFQRKEFFPFLFDETFSFGAKKFFHTSKKEFPIWNFSSHFRFKYSSQLQMIHYSTWLQKNGYLEKVISQSRHFFYGEILQR